MVLTAKSPANLCDSLSTSARRSATSGESASWPGEYPVESVSFYTRSAVVYWLTGQDADGQYR